ncbi:hypothetical protein ES703_65451 [subsurface metagenome]|nr:hypothetical protein [bacterium]
MLLSLIFLGFVTSSTPNDSLPEVKALDHCLERLTQLTLLDLQTRLRAAWFIPEFSVKRESLAVAGSRPGEVRFLLDGVPLWDPQTGENTVWLPKTLPEEASLRNEEASLAPVVAIASRKILEGWHAQLEYTSPFFLSQEQPEGHAEVFLNVPVGSKLSLSFDGAAGLWNERPEANLELPHRGLAAYTGVASATLVPSEGMLARARVIRCQIQRDRFSSEWAFNPASAPSSFARVNLVILNYLYRTEILDLEMALSGYSSFLWKGSRKEGELALFRPFDEQDSAESAAALDTRNPFGVKGIFYSQGFYPGLIARNSTANRARAAVGIFAGEMNEIRARFSYTSLNLISDITKWDGAEERTANFQETPHLAGLYLGDRIHLDRFWIEPGLGFAYLGIEKPDTSEVETEISEYTISLAPRIETRAYLGGVQIRAGTDMPAAIPPFAVFFDTKDETPLADSLILIPKIDPTPERAWRAWFEVQKGWGKRWTTGISFYSSLGYRLLAGGLNPTEEPTAATPAAGVFLEGKSFSLGLGPWLEYRSEWLGIRAAYRFASAKSTTLGPIGDYERLLAGDSPSDEMQRMPLDSRHKFTLQANLATSEGAHFLLRDWFLGPGFALASGFPGEEGEEGGEGDIPWWAWCEVAAGRVISIGGLEAEIKIELLNPFNWKDPVFGELPAPSLPTEEEFPDRVVLGDEDYHPSRDANHDGVVTAAEEVAAYQRARAFYDAYTPSPLSARSLEFKISVRF